MGFLVYSAIFAAVAYWSYEPPRGVAFTPISEAESRRQGNQAARNNNI